MNQELENAPLTKEEKKLLKKEAKRVQFLLV